MRFFTSDLRRNLIKIICLTAGLAIGFILVAKIYVEVTFDSFYPESDRLYILWESFNQNDEYKEYISTAGAIAPGVKQYAPGVESATRYTHCFGGNDNLTLDNGKVLSYEGMIMADSCFFDVLKHKVLSGDAIGTLSVRGHCMIPRSMADKIGDNPVGMTFTLPSFSKNYTFTVGGVYEDFPVNSTIDNVIILSLESIADITWDGRDNWMGNDRYRSIVRLAKGVEPAELKPYLDKMLRDNVGEESVEKTGYALNAHRLSDWHSESGAISSMLWMLAILAVLILVSAALNYLLIVLGQMGSRSKEMAIRKCYGTGRAKIFARIMGESVFFLVVSMALAVLIVLYMSDTVGQIMGYTAKEMLSAGGVWWTEGGVCLLLLVITGVMPAWIYCQTPVVSVFRSNPRSRRLWKLAFLAVQFFASGLLICMLTLVMRQYNLMTDSDRGYETDNIAFLYAYGMKRSERASLIEAIRELPEVEAVTTTYQELSGGASGNNIWTTDPFDNYNVADLYNVNPNMFDVMGVRFVQGHGFDEQVDSTVNQIIVEERMIGVMRKYFNFDSDDLIGKTLFISEHYDGNTPIEFTICGVVENMQRGGFSEETSDMRPAVMFPGQAAYLNVYIRFIDMNPESLAKVHDLIKRMQPECTGVPMPYGPYVEAYNTEVRNFGKLVMISAITILLIAMIGLIGYTGDEVQRRAREIAIRKVNGTSTLAVMRLFCTDTLRVAIPALLLGGVTAMFIGRKWLSQFTSQVSLSPFIMTLSLIVLVMLVLIVVILNSWHIARANPVKYLRTE